MIKLPPHADILPPSDDRIFKTLLTHPEAKPALINLLSAVTERPVLDARIRNTELPVSDAEEKSERLDVNCIIDENDQIDVEMHGSRIEEIASGHKNFINKYIYYLTDLHSSQKSKGVKYYELVRTYQVTFSEYTIFPDRADFVNRFSMRRETGEQLNDQITMVIIELSKLGGILKKPVKDLTLLEMWSVFFKYAADERNRHYINEIIERKEEIAMAGALLMEISKDEKERAHMRSRRMFETDQISNILTAEARGEAKGIIIGKAEGKAEGKIEIASMMKKSGMPIGSI